MKALVDNDVLLKGSCYGLLTELLDPLPGYSHHYGILGAARFVVPKLIERARLRRDSAAAQHAFQQFVAQNDVLEPTPSEQRLAAELESSAQTLALNFDTGESQLTAIAALRALPCLVTGDKRAINALEKLVDAVPALRDIVGRIQCLEQCVRLLVENADAAAVCDRICAEPEVDKALSTCCSCAGGQASYELLCECLDGYIADLRAAAPRILAT